MQQEWNHLVSCYVKEIMAVQVNTLSEIFDFSQMNDQENEEFCDRMITKKMH